MDDPRDYAGGYHPQGYTRTCTAYRLTAAGRARVLAVHGPVKRKPLSAKLRAALGLGKGK